MQNKCGSCAGIVSFYLSVPNASYAKWFMVYVSRISASNSELNKESDAKHS